jgi:hypothetical protein
MSSPSNASTAARQYCGAVRIRQIHDGRADLRAELLAEGGPGALQLRLGASAEHQISPGGREGPGDIGTNPLGGTRDQRSFAVES